MSEHTHEWVPVEMEFGRYKCKVPGCIATGFKLRFNGPIRPHKVPREYGKSEVQEGPERKGRRGPGGW